jgi:hypothetical protein
VPESYYRRRSTRDPDWHRQQLEEARERDRRRREADPEGERARAREATRRSREAQAASGYTFQELLRRVGGDRAMLSLVLNDEVRRGRVDYLGSSRRYRLNGGLPADVRAALLALGPGLGDASAPAPDRDRRRMPWSAGAEAKARSFGD